MSDNTLSAKSRDHLSNHLLFFGFAVVHVRPRSADNADSLNPFDGFSRGFVLPQIDIQWRLGRFVGSAPMDEEVVEFSVAHNRKYSRDHLWYQEKGRPDS